MYLVTRNNQVIGTYWHLQDFLTENFDVSIEQKEEGGWLVSIRSVSPFYRSNAWSGAWDETFTRENVEQNLIWDSRVQSFLQELDFSIYSIQRTIC